MTITFESEQEIIIYALEKIISYARNNQYIFLAQSVWWISSIIGLQQGLIIHIDNLKVGKDIENSKDELVPTITGVHPDQIVNFLNLEDSYSTSEGDPISMSEDSIHNEIIDNCEAFLAQSKEERKDIGRRTRQASRVVKRKAEGKANRETKKEAKRKLRTFGTQTEGIDGSEL
jgi:hypothetical protein